jgi:hypothetical protein
MLAANESIEIDRMDGLVLANKDGDTFGIYDLASDSRHPVLRFSSTVPRLMSHASDSFPEGRMLYGASLPSEPIRGSRFHQPQRCSLSI